MLQTDGQTVRGSGPITRPAFAKGMQVTFYNIQIVLEIWVSGIYIHSTNNVLTHTNVEPDQLILRVLHQPVEIECS